MSVSSPQDAADSRGDGDDAGVAPDARRRLIATAVGVDEPGVRTLVDQIRGGLDALLGTVLSDPVRLEALRRTGLLDGESQPELDRFARMAAAALGTHFAAVAVVTPERQFFVGSNTDNGYARSVELDLSVAKFLVVSQEPLIVDNAALHPLLADHAAVTGGMVSAYAGVPLIDASGNAIGAFCTWDERPRNWTSGQIQILNDLAHLAASKIFARVR